MAQASKLSPSTNGLAPNQSKTFGPRYVQSYLDNTGQRRCYFRRKGYRVALPIDSSTAEFKQQYHEACAHYEREFLPSRKYISGGVDYYRIAEKLLKYAQKRCYTKQMDCLIDAHWIATRIEENRFRCELSGVPFRAPTKGRPKGEPFAASLDRVDNSVGYTPENVRVICYALNVALNQWGLDPLLIIADGIVDRYLYE